MIDPNDLTPGTVVRLKDVTVHALTTGGIYVRQMHGGSSIVAFVPLGHIAEIVRPAPKPKRKWQVGDRFKFKNGRIYILRGMTGHSIWIANADCPETPWTERLSLLDDATLISPAPDGVRHD